MRSRMLMRVTVAGGLLAWVGACAAAAGPAADAAALVDKMPAFGANSAFEGPPRAEAEKVFDRILAGGAPAVTAVVDLLEPPPAQNFKPRYVLHAMAQYLGDPRLAEKRKVFIGALGSALGGNRPKWVQGFVARQLEVVGDETAAPALGRLLLDDENCEYAVLALSAIGGPGSAAELRRALPQARGKVRRAIIQGLGAVRDAASTADIVKALADADRDTRITAGQALGSIGDPAAIAALLKAARAESNLERAQMVAACLALGRRLLETGKPADAKRLLLALYEGDKSQHVQCAALQALAPIGDEDVWRVILAAARSEDARIRAAAAQAAARATPGIPGEAENNFAKLKDAAPDVRAQFLAAVTRQVGCGALPALEQGLKDESPEVRKAAVRAMGLTGEAQAPLAAMEAGDKDLLGEAAQALAAVAASAGPEGAVVEKKVAAALPQMPPPAKVALLGLLADRMAIEQLPAVLKVAAEEKDESARAAAVRAAGALGGQAQAAAVIGWVTGESSDAIRQAAEEALIALGRKDVGGEAVAAAAARAAGGASGAAKAALVRALGAIGRDPGLAVLRQAAAGGDAELKEAAVRGLAEWPTAAPAADLLRLASGDAPPTLQVLALRGYVRLIEAPGSAESPEARLAMCKAAMAAARRPDEKRLVLGTLSRVPLAGAVEVAAPCLDEKDLAGEAASAVIRAATALKEITPPVRAALEKAAGVTTDRRLLGDAQRLLAPGGK